MQQENRVEVHGSQTGQRRGLPEESGVPPPAKARGFHTANPMNRKRVVIAGLGDVGVLTAIRLAKHANVVGISVKPALVSGQELGIRLSRPNDWARDNWIPFDRFRQ